MGRRAGFIRRTQVSTCRAQPQIQRDEYIRRRAPYVWSRLDKREQEGAGTVPGLAVAQVTSYGRSRRYSALLLEHALADYRLFFLVNNRIRRCVELECDTDEAAIGVMDDHADGHAMELWQLARLVKRVPARPRLKP